VAESDAPSGRRGPSDDGDTVEGIVRCRHRNHENEHTDREYRTPRESLSQRLVDR